MPKCRLAEMTRTRHLTAFQYSPSRDRESELRREKFRLCRGESFRECVDSHVVGGAANEPDGATFGAVSITMKAGVDVFSTCVVLVILRWFFCQKRGLSWRGRRRKVVRGGREATRLPSQHGEWRRTRLPSSRRLSPAV